MNRSQIPFYKMLLAGVLAAGLGVVAGSAYSSDAMNSTTANSKSSHPHRGHVAATHEQEKAVFARFEEKPGVAKDGHKSMYHGIQGQRPPFKRN